MLKGEKDGKGKKGNSFSGASNGKFGVGDYCDFIDFLNCLVYSEFQCTLNEYGVSLLLHDSFKILFLVFLSISLLFIPK